MRSSINLPGRLKEQARKEPEALALLAAGQRPLTYAGLEAQVGYTAAALKNIGVAPNDRVATLVSDGPEALALFLGVSEAAICAPLNPAFKSAELRTRLSYLRARVLVTEERYAALAEAVALPNGTRVVLLRPDPAAGAGRFHLAGIDMAAASEAAYPSATDYAVAMHTSGTTSVPKLVQLTHEQLCFAASTSRESLRLGCGDRLLSIMPLFHMHGLMAAVSSLLAGGSVVCTRRFDAREFLESVAVFRPTWYSAAPAFHRAIVDEVRARGSFLGHALRFIRSASAALPRGLMQDLEDSFGVPVIEAYGLTEAPSPVTTNALPPGLRKPGSVGRSIGAEVAVVDANGRVLPRLQTGEIVIRGGAVASRYEHAPGRDSGAFRDGWLRSGDQGYFDEDGYLFLTGRLNDVISRGGEKISPREIEAVILTHPEVRDAAVFGVPHATLGQDVAAVVATNGSGLTDAAIRTYAVSRLAPFKVPSVITTVAAMPTGATGKIDKDRLRDMVGARATGTPGGGGTGGSLNELIARTWAEVLELKETGTETHFFLSGGDSLRGLRLISRIAERTDVLLTLDDVYENPTPRALAAVIRTRQAVRLEGRPVLRRVEATGAAVPLSSGQQRLWFLEQLYPDKSLYNVAVTLLVNGPLDVTRLQRALERLVERHEVLRTTFSSIDGMPVQSVGDPWPARVGVVSVQDGSGHERLARALAITRAFALEPFKLEGQPLVRAVLFALGAERHVFALCLHHTLSDAWTEDILVRDLVAIYDSLGGSRPAELPALPIRYTDYVRWQIECARSPERRSGIESYIREAKLQAKVSEVRPCSPRNADPSFEGRSHFVRLQPSVSSAIRDLCARESVTPFVGLVAVFHVLLSAASDSSRTAVACPFAGRPLPQAEHVAGYFANTVLLPGDLTADSDFTRFLRVTNESVCRARTYEHIPFEELVKALQPKRRVGKMPLFQAWFHYRRPAPVTRNATDVSFTQLDLPLGRARYDLKLTVSDLDDGGLGVHLECAADLFSAGRVRAFAEEFAALTEHLARNPAAGLHATVAATADRLRRRAEGGPLPERAAPGTASAALPGDSPILAGNCAAVTR